LKKWITSLLPLAIAFAAVVSPLNVLPTTYAAESKFKDTANHWGADSIDWAVQSHIVDGYADGTFLPDNAVSEPEFLAMLLRAYPDIKIPAAASGAAWSKPYYDIADSQNWPVQHNANRNSYNRGYVALVVAATQKGTVNLTDAINYLLNQGLSQGKTAPTLDGYRAVDKLSRAEAVQFIRNLKDKQFQIKLNKDQTQTPASSVPAPTSPALPVTPIAPVVSASAISEASTAAVVKGVRIGDSAKAVVSMLGQPARQDASEYGFTWYIYNQDYASYAQIGISEGKVVALYSLSGNWENNKGIADGSPKTDVLQQYGTPLEAIKKGNTKFILNYGKSEYGTYEIDGSYVTFFYDLFRNNVVTGIQVIAKPTELSMAAFYPDASNALITSYERESFDLANANRVKLGKSILIWDDTISGTARKHSQDMAAQNYFAHESPDGLSPFDRMEADGLKLRAASENIAAGQTSAIFAHHSWMNSEGHRVNLLSDIKKLGTGVAFGGKMSIYYAQNFYTPK
jgi:uncharacterized protein YkwD